jgi:hypothetical protein
MGHPLLHRGQEQFQAQIFDRAGFLQSPLLEKWVKLLRLEDEDGYCRYELEVR